MGKVGANANYFLEFEAASAMALGAAGAHFLAVSRASSREARVQLVLALVAIQIAAYSVVTGLQALSARQTLDLITAGEEALRPYVYQMQGAVVGDEVMGALVLAGKRVEIQPFEYTQLTAEGKWDQRVFLQSIAARKYAAIIVKQRALHVGNVAGDRALLHPRARVDRP